MIRSSDSKIVLGLFLMSLFTQTACGEGETFKCGDDLTCSEGEVCVEKALFAEEKFSCVENPCSGELSCDCAESVCDGTTCGSAEGHTVSCVCLACETAN
jgi:hypothetical protein